MRRADRRDPASRRPRWIDHCRAGVPEFTLSEVEGPAEEGRGANHGPRWIDRWWVQALVAGWILLVVTLYFRLQLIRLLEIAQGK